MPMTIVMTQADPRDVKTCRLVRYAPATYSCPPVNKPSPRPT